MLLGSISSRQASGDLSCGSLQDVHSRIASCRPLDAATICVCQWNHGLGTAWVDRTTSAERCLQRRPSPNYRCFRPQKGVSFAVAGRPSAAAL